MLPTYPLRDILSSQAILSITLVGWSLCACNLAHAKSRPPPDKTVVAAWSPLPGTSGLSTDVAVYLSVGLTTGSAVRVAQAAGDLGTQLELWDLTTGKALASTLDAASPDGDPRAVMLRLRPGSPLVDGHDYGVRLAAHPRYFAHETPNGELTHFYVGSRPRVRLVRIKSSAPRVVLKQTRPGRVGIAVEFSEDMDPASLSPAVRISDVATGVFAGLSTFAEAHAGMRSMVPVQRIAWLTGSGRAAMNQKDGRQTARAWPGGRCWR